MTKIKCYKCGNVWDYLGKATHYISCTNRNCRAKLSLRKIFRLQGIKLTPEKLQQEEKKVPQETKSNIPQIPMEKSNQKIEKRMIVTKAKGGKEIILKVENDRAEVKQIGFPKLSNPNPYKKEVKARETEFIEKPKNNRQDALNRKSGEVDSVNSETPFNLHPGKEIVLKNILHLNKPNIEEIRKSESKEIVPNYKKVVVKNLAEEVEIIEFKISPEVRVLEFDLPIKDALGKRKIPQKD